MRFKIVDCKIHHNHSKVKVEFWKNNGENPETDKLDEQEFFLDQVTEENDIVKATKQAIKKYNKKKDDEPKFINRFIDIDAE